MSDWLVSDALAPALDEHDPVGALYAAAARGVLALPFCGACGLALELEQRVCDGCLQSQVQWRPVTPTGTVHSVTMVHRREPELLVFDGPYPVLDVEVASGHRLVMTTDAPTGTPPLIGAPVAIVFRQVGAVHLPAARLE